MDREERGSGGRRMEEEDVLSWWKDCNPLLNPPVMLSVAIAMGKQPIFPSIAGLSMV